VGILELIGLVASIIGIIDFSLKIGPYLFKKIIFSSRWFLKTSLGHHGEPKKAANEGKRPRIILGYVIKSGAAQAVKISPETGALRFS
jgi:hypothetical protein